MGREWSLLDNQPHSSWCISHAVAYAKRLEALMSAEELSAADREQCILQLFNLYIQAARESSKAKQQSLANNMLAKALQLSKQEVVQPFTKAAMDLSLAELQQADAHSRLKTSLESDQNSDSVALVLFEAADKHIADALNSLEEPSKTKSSTIFDQQQLRSKALEMRVQVLVATAQAHLASGEAMLAFRKLDDLKEFDNTTSSSSQSKSMFSSLDDWFCTVGYLLVDIYLALEDVLAAAQILSICASNAPPSTTARSRCKSSESRSKMFDPWMRGFQSTLNAIPTISTSPAAEIVVATAVADGACAGISSAASAQQCSQVEAILRCLLGSEGREDICLKVLATNKVISLVIADTKLQSTCFSMLRTVAAQNFLDCKLAKCASLLTAALQYAPQKYKATTAEFLAATYLRLDNPQKALDYLNIADTHGRGSTSASSSSSLGALISLCSALSCQNSSLEQRALHQLKSCPDFHVETAFAAAQVASCLSTLDPRNEAQVLEMAVNLLIPEDKTCSTMISGQECDLLSYWIHALLRHVLNLKNKINGISPSSSSGGGGAGGTNNEDKELRTAMCSLVFASKLSTKRLKTLGIEKFAGRGGDGGDRDKSKLENLALQGYRACAEALHLGLYDQCVTLSSSTCVLLEDLVSYKGGDEMRALQAKVLLLAAQALLSTFRGSPSTTNTTAPALNTAKQSSRLNLAIKLLKKAAEMATKAETPTSSTTVLSAIFTTLLEIACLQGKQTDMLDNLNALSQVSTCLTASQVATVVAATSTASSVVKSAACTVLLKILPANSTREERENLLSMGVLGEILFLGQSSKQKLEVLNSAFKLYSSPVVVLANNSNNRLQERQWLAAECYNLGASYARSDPCSAILFFQFASDADDRLHQLCSAAIGKLKFVAENQPASPPPQQKAEETLPKKKEKEEESPVFLKGVSLKDASKADFPATLLPPPPLVVLEEEEEKQPKEDSISSPQSLLLVPSAVSLEREKNTEEDEQHAAKRQKMEASPPPAAAVTVTITAAVPARLRPPSKIVLSKKAHQSKQYSGWLSSMLSAQRKAAGGGGGSSGGKAAKRRTSFFIPPRPTTTTITASPTPDPPPITASAPVQDTADALSLDSAGDLS